MRYGGKHRGGSHPGLVTIGGGGSSSYARQSKGGTWSRFDRSATGSRITDEQYGVSDDVEMEPRGTTVTVISADRHGSSPELAAKDHRLSNLAAKKGGGGHVVSTTAQRDSDEFPIMGIKQTVQLEWSVETANPHHKGR